MGQRSIGLAAVLRHHPEGALGFGDLAGIGRQDRQVVLRDHALFRTRVLLVELRERLPHGLVLGLLVGEREHELVPCLLVHARLLDPERVHQRLLPDRVLVTDKKSAKMATCAQLTVATVRKAAFLPRTVCPATTAMSAPPIADDLAAVRADVFDGVAHFQGESVSLELFARNSVHEVPLPEGKLYRNMP
ncbi:MAG: hypothetical protein NTY38_30990 [Acidobacteria bacterium]|nr:hypothetical protein [Acidobacteriota bacterium]